MVEADDRKGCCATGGGSSGGQPTAKQVSNTTTLPMSVPQTDSSTEVKFAKIIFMGDAKVGKTSIIKAFIDDELQRDKKIKPTSVISDFSKQMVVRNDDGSQTTLQLNIWDAAGEADVHHLAHLFLKDVQCGVLVFDITSKRSYDELAQWKEHLENQEKILPILVGSKSDLSDQRIITPAFATEKKEELECSFYAETSAWADL